MTSNRNWFNTKWCMTKDDVRLVNRVAQTMIRMGLVNALHVDLRFEEDLPTCSCCSGMYVEHSLFEWYSRLDEERSHGER